MDTNPDIATTGLIERMKGILATPTEEWSRIEAETTPRSRVFTGYVLPLLAVGPVAMMIRSQLYGSEALGTPLPPTLSWMIGTAVVSLGLGVAMFYVLVTIIDWLAPKFDGQANRDQAFKLVAYGGTAAWASSIFQAIPILSAFTVLGLYSLRLYYLGAPVLMKVPQERAIGYVVVVIVCVILAALVIGPLAGILTALTGLTY